MKIEIKEGKNGRWRWFLREEDGYFRAMGMPYGFDSKEQAIKNAKLVFTGPITMYELFAEERDLK